MHNHVHKYVWVRWGWWSGGVVWGVVWGPPFLPLPLSDSPPGLCFYFYIYFYIYFIIYFYIYFYLSIYFYTYFYMCFYIPLRISIYLFLSTHTSASILSILILPHTLLRRIELYSTCRGLADLDLESGK